MPENCIHLRSLWGERSNCTGRAEKAVQSFRMFSYSQILNQNKFTGACPHLPPTFGLRFSGAENCQEVREEMKL